MSVEGACRCGRVRYRLATDRLPPVYACHCLDCQRWSGSAFTLNALVPAGKLELGGETATYAHSDPTGFRSVQHVCAACHTRIYNTNEAVPGLLILRAGTLNDSAYLRPVAHIWTRRMQGWITLPDGIARFDESPTPEQFARATGVA